MAVNPAVYIKNLGKSIAYSSLDLAKEYVPAGESLAETNKEIFKEVYYTISNPTGSLKRLSEYIKSSKVYEAGEVAFKATLEDLSTGNFYNKQRISEMESRAAASFMDSGMDEFNFDDMELDLDFDFDDVEDGDKYIGATIEKASYAEASAISKTVAKSTKYIAETNKASTSLLYNLNMKGFEAVSSSVSTVNENVGQLIQFTNNTLKSYLENSLKNSDKMTKYLEEQTAMMKEIRDIQVALNPKPDDRQRKGSGRRAEDLFDANGMLDFKGYIKASANNLFKQSGLSAMMGMNDSFGEDANLLLTFASSPLKFITDIIAKKAVPEVLDKSLKTFNNTLSSFFATNLFKLSAYGKRENEDNKILSVLGKFFGLDTNIKTTIDVSAYNKGPVPFDGIVKKAITEVIPAHLSRIEAAILGSVERYYDYEKGKWIDRNVIEEDRKKYIEGQFKSAGRPLAEAAKMMVDQGRLVFDTKKEQDKFFKDLDKFLVSIGQDIKFFNPDDKNDTYFKEVFKQNGIDDTNLDIIKAIAKGMSRDTLMSIYPEMLRAGSTINNRYKAEELKGNSVLNFINDDSKEFNEYDKDTKQIKKGTTLFEKNLLVNQKDEYRKNIFFYLRESLKSLISIDTKTLQQSSSKGPKQRRGKRYSQYFPQSVAQPNRTGYAPVGSDYFDSLIGEREKTDAEKKRERELNAEENFEKQKEKLAENAKKKGITQINVSDLLNGNEEDRIKKAIDLAIESKYALKEKEEKDKREEKEKGLLAELFGSDENDKIFDFGKIRGYMQKPGSLIAKIVDKANQRLYDLTFGNEDEILKINGKPIRHYLDLANTKFNEMITKVSDKLDEKIFDPLKNYFGAESLSEFFGNIFENFTGRRPREFGKDIWDSLFGKDQGIISGVVDGFKETFKSAWDWTKDTFKSATEPVTDIFKGAKRYDSEGNPVGLSSALTNKINAFRKEKKEKEKNKEPETKALGARSLRMVPGEEEAKVIVAYPGEMIIPQHLNPFYKGKRTPLDEQMRREDKTKNEFITKYASKVGKYIPSFAPGVKELPSEEYTPTASEYFGQRDRKESQYIFDDVFDGANHRPGGITTEEWLSDRFTKEDRAEYRSYIANNDSAITRGAKDLVEGSKRAAKELGFKGLKINNSSNELFNSAVNDIMANIQPNIGRGAAGAVIGGLGLNIITGGLVPPMLGAAIGSSVSIASRSQAVQDWLFGKEDENGDWKDGVIPKKTMEGIKKYVPSMAKGGVIGALASFLPFVPGGPIVGLMVGSTVGYLKQNEEFQKSLFGEEFVKGTKEFKKKLQVKMPKILTGMGLGAVTGLVLGGPFGLLGNMAIGGGLGFLSSTKKFEDLLYGKEINGERQGGLLGQLKISIVDPLRGWVKEQKNAFTKWVKENLLDPVKYAFQPIVKQIELMVKGLVNTVTDVVGKVFKEYVGIPMHRYITQYFVEPAKKIFAPLFWVAKQPFKLLGGMFGDTFNTIGTFGRKAQIRSGNADYMSARERLEFRDKKGMIKRDQFNNVIPDFYAQYDENLANMDTKQLDTTIEQFKFIQDMLKKNSSELTGKNSDILGYLEGAMTSQEAKVADIKKIAGFARQGQYDEIEKLMSEGGLDKIMPKKVRRIFQGGRLSMLSDEKKQKVLRIATEYGDKYQKEFEKSKASYDAVRQALLDMSGGDVATVNKILKNPRELDKLINYARKEKNYRDPAQKAAEEEREHVDVFRQNVQEKLQEIVDKLSIITGEKPKKGESENGEQAPESIPKPVAEENTKSETQSKAEEYTNPSNEESKQETPSSVPDLTNIQTESNLQEKAEKVNEKDNDSQQHVTDSGKIVTLVRDDQTGKLEHDMTDSQTREAVESEEQKEENLNEIAKSSSFLSRIADFIGIDKKKEGEDKKSGGFFGLLGKFFGGAKTTLTGLLTGGGLLGLFGKLLTGGGILALLGTDIGQTLVKGFASIVTTVLPELVKGIVSNLPGILKGLFNTAKEGAKFVGQELFDYNLEEQVTDENGNPMYDENGQPIMQKGGGRSELIGDLSAAALMKKLPGGKNLGKILMSNTKIGKNLGNAAGSLIKSQGRNLTRYTTAAMKVVREKIISLVTHPRVARVLGESGVEAVTKKVIPNILSALPKFMKNATSKIATSVASGGLFNVIMAVYGFLDGMTDARRILGIMENPTTGQRIIAGLVRAINQFVTLGLIPEHILVNLILDPMAEALGIADELRAQRDATQQLVDEYNEQYGTEYSVKEYQDKVEDMDGGIISRAMKSVKKFFKGSDPTPVSSETTYYRFNTSASNVNNARPISLDGKGTGLARFYGRGNGEEPILSQNDPRIANKKFGNSTVSESGCAPSAAAMFLNQSYNNVDINDTLKYTSKYQNKDGSVDARYFKDVFSKYGYNTSYSEDKDDAVERIKNGEPLIILGKQPGNNSKMKSPFGSSPHYIIANEITNDNQVIIKDPETGMVAYYDKSVLNGMQLAISAKKSVMGKVQKHTGKGSLARFFGGSSDTANNERIIYEFLINEMGINTAAACGVLANIQAESGFRPNAEGDIGYSGGSSIGICQWREGRRNNLIKFCRENGYDHNSLTGQLWFLKHELETGYKKLVNTMRSVPNNAQGAYQVAYNWCVDFERPANKKVKGDQRGNTAKQFWAKYSGQAVEGNSSISDGSLYANTGIDSSSSSTDNSVYGKFIGFLGDMFKSPYKAGVNALLGMSSSGATSGIPTTFTNMSSDATTAKDWFKDTLKNSKGDSVSRVSSEYGPRTHPVSGEPNKMHKGIDFAAPAGTPIHTPVSGKVIVNKYSPKGYGNYVTIEDNSGGKHIFGHMRDKSPLAVGTQVTRGDQVGVVGTTGSSTGNHLHYQVNTNDRSVNPDAYLSTYTGGASGIESPLKNVNNKKFSAEGRGGGESDKSKVIYESIISILLQMLEGTNAISDIKDLLVEYFKAESEVDSSKGTDSKEAKAKKSKARENIINIIQGSEQPEDDTKKTQLIKQLKMIMAE